MNIRRIVLITILVIPGLCLSVVGQVGISDPYEVLSRHFDATGGLEQLKAEQSAYFEGSLSVGGMEGTVKQWTSMPHRSRSEIDVGPFNMIQGDNGEYRWILDTNGKLQKTTVLDEATRKRREVRQLIAEYAHVDPESGVFSVTLEGMEKVEGRDCYVVKVANRINVDFRLMYINAETFLAEKIVFSEDEESRDALFGDYRQVDGLVIPFLRKETDHRTGQSAEITITAYVSNPEIDPAMFEPPQEVEKDYRFLSGDRVEDIPFRFVEGHLYIPVVAGGKERLWILDTGAGMSVLTRTLATELGLQLEGEVKGQGAGGTVEASFATLPPYHIQGIDFEEQTVAVIDMSELVRRLGVDIGGILGYDFLSRFVTKVDYARELVSFYDPETFVYDGDGQQLPIHIDQGSFEVTATLDGDHEGTWLFDLGAGSTHLDGAYAIREGYKDKQGVLGMGHGAGNEFHLKSVIGDSLEFAGFTVNDPKVSFVFEGVDTTYISDRIGTLGNTLFRNLVLYCDYAHERVIVERGEKFNQPWPEGRSGLQLMWSYDHDVEVSYVSPGTPAEKAGFVRGDLLKVINDVDIESFDGLIAVRKLFTAEPGTTYSCVVDRAGEEKKLTLTLAELY